MLLTDVHNLIHVVKKTFRGGRTDAERAIAELDEFIESATGNTAECIVDSKTNVIRVVTFQSARQKRLFAAFPEVVLVDSTHGTNVNRYKLFTFRVHDVFGLGQYVQHALVQTEEKANLALSVGAFKRNNPQWSKIEVEMTDKAMHEKEVLHDAWPNARQLLCRWHVETWLKKQCSRLGGVGRAETMKLKVIMKELVNAESQEEYGDLKDSLLETLGNDKENRLYMSFMQHWDTTTDEWVMFKRGDVPHLMNNTNNRLESKWGRIKEVIDTHMTIDELISMLITLQGYAEERYLSEWHRVGSRVQINEDRELKSIRQLSTYAFRIVSDQYKLAVGPQANYSIDMDCEKTRLTNPATGKAHEVDPRGDHKDAVKDMNLGKWHIGRHVQYGSEFLDFRENLWLHSSSITGALFALKETYEEVGIVNPRFLDFDTMEQRCRTARSFGAADPGIKSVVSIVNLGYHWGEFSIDVHQKRSFLFDPLQLQSNLTSLKNAVRTVVETMLNMTDRIQFDVISGCKQMDNSSYGLWCLVVLELLLFGATQENWSDYWSDSLYEEVMYLRMSYLHKVIRLQGHLSVDIDEVSE
ncbi:hypothetical protein AM588_10008562 [Phytophthora nicotianae]|uniref:ZSWIM1/3 RNaseH-like domain-containing protein n=1 Tax=Phytophthora nicotianae TaxID=4792 RepID=A0A0W8DII5_PHYNI|nr:hypothetical protein AM588_10008562 [Phytophthora nicotianae]